MKKFAGDIILPKITVTYVWFLRYGMRQTKSSAILGNFLPFYPLTDLKKQWTNGQADLRVTYRGGCPI